MFDYVDQKYTLLSVNDVNDEWLYAGEFKCYMFKCFQNSSRVVNE